jgi:hypothetical protein
MFTLIRHAPHKDGTFGTLVFKGQLICLTLELPWRKNQIDVSCIPEGLFPIKRRRKWFGAERYGNTFEVMVEYRSGILIHPANTVDELRGCIAPGMGLGRLNGRKAVLQSADAFRDLMFRMNTIESSHLHVIRLLS